MMDSLSLFNEQMVAQRLLNLISSTGYELVQSNGQRRYGPPPQSGSPVLSRKCEVFVGKIPRDCFEDELVPFMEMAGKIYEMRLMMDFRNCNRGYAFVTYMSPDAAAKAINELNNTEIRKGWPVGIVQTENRRRLFIGGIPKTKRKEEVLRVFSHLLAGVEGIILYQNIIDRSKNRGFAFIEFDSHRSAAMGRRILLSDNCRPWGKDLAVDWAEPEITVDESVMAKVQVLYVRNLAVSTSEERLKQIFELKCTEIIDRVKRVKDFAFVHFHSREAAEKALSIMNGIYLDGSCIEVAWAKPISTETQLNQKMAIRNKWKWRVPTPALSTVRSTVSCCPRTMIQTGGVEGAAGYVGVENYIPIPGGEYAMMTTSEDQMVSNVRPVDVGHEHNL